jgi:hypothetical protein
MFPNGMFAHTSPVYVDLDGQRIGRADDATWCLEWLSHLERMVRNEGRFSSVEQLDDVLGVIEAGRGHYLSLQEGLRS